MGTFCSYVLYHFIRMNVFVFVNEANKNEVSAKIVNCRKYSKFKKSGLGQQCIVLYSVKM